MPDWSYPNQYNPCTQSYEYNFQLFTESMGIHLPRVQVSTNLSTYPPCPQFSKYSFPDFASYAPFLNKSIEEKSSLERSMEESLQQMQNLLNSQSFAHQTIFWILPTWHIITLTNLVCRIGLIRINTTHVPNLMTIITKIILTLHRIIGVHLPRI